MSSGVNRHLPGDRAAADVGLLETLRRARDGAHLRLSEGDLFRYEDGNREAEANWFAAELLMPGKLFRPLCNIPKPTFDAIGEIARKCGTSLTAASIRFVQLGPERCAFIWSEDGKVKWSVRSPDFPEWIPRGQVLTGLSHASDVFDGKTIPKGPQPVPQHAWLEQRVAGGCDLMEESIAFRKLNAALTLLWLPMDGDEDNRDNDDDDLRWRDSAVIVFIAVFSPAEALGGDRPRGLEVVGVGGRDRTAAPDP
jgi:hypothetical protein